MPVIVDAGTTRKVLVRSNRTVTVRSRAAERVITDDSAAVRVAERNTRTLTAVARGPKGDTGENGVDADNLVLGTCGHAISALRVVRYASDGKVYRADSGSIPDAGELIGISVTATSAADETLTVRLEGRMTDAVWSWSPGPIYCGANGVLTQVAPLTGFVCEVARALTPTEIVVDIQSPFIRG